jgi:hypothetical protein
MATQEAALNWGDLASTRVGEIEPPKGIPDGHYSGIITGAGKIDNVGQNKTLLIEFPMRLNEPLSDVDEEAFAESDGFDKDGYSLGFYLTPKSLYRFTEFGKAMGGSDDMSIPELAEYLASCGNEFCVTASHGVSKKGRSFRMGRRL